MVIQGTSLDPNDSNNWGSAITTGLGLPSDFQKQVKLTLLDLPAGAIVHMAGHSQGGIVAQNLVIEKDVTSHVTVKSVTTFGSPYTVPEGDATYYRYAAQGDIVPYLEGRDAFAVMLLLPFTGTLLRLLWLTGIRRQPLPGTSQMAFWGHIQCTVNRRNWRKFQLMICHSRLQPGMECPRYMIQVRPIRVFRSYIKTLH